ncbi:hypothetical protein CcCBS67573_g05884 [Chytriomyces confervae]|uniref:Uncharacterized protein n=1 Tax=Chytriomyces confervae TaxID=246404 RepID=A0A507F9M5_9FUNG|nr:hypothetical protein CcCBS67573_g05884 [Chytriomyces confervae]
MDPFSLVALYVQRPLAAGEDAAETLMPPMPLLPDAEPGAVYRRIDDAHPLHVAVHAGGTFNIYGVLLLTPRINHQCFDISIEISFVGISRTLWSDGLKDLHQVTEPFPVPSNGSNHIHMPFSFFITTTADGDGLPITFKSETASVSYAIKAKIMYTQPGHHGLATATHSAPTQVHPPWIAAPPPPTPLLGPSEDGTRLVVDSLGSYQGRANLVPSSSRVNGATSLNEGLDLNPACQSGGNEDVYLRPRVLNNLIERKIAASLRSVDGFVEGYSRSSVDSQRTFSSVGGAVDMARGYSASVLDVRRGSGATLDVGNGISILGRSMSEASHLHVVQYRDLHPQSDGNNISRCNLATIQDVDEGGQIGFEEAESTAAIPRTPPMEYAEKDPLAGFNLYALTITPFPEVTSSLNENFQGRVNHLEPESMMPQDLHSSQHNTMDNARVSHPSAGNSEVVDEPYLNATTPPTTPPTSPPTSATFLPSRSANSMLKKLFRRVERAIGNNGSQSPRGSTTTDTSQVPTVASLTTNPIRPPAHPPVRASIDSSADYSVRSNSPAESLLEYLSAPINDIPRFRVILPCTMVGPGSRVPIDIAIQSVPHGQVVAGIEVILIAQVTCTAFGHTHDELIELASVREHGDGVESPGFLFKKRMWIQVPDADELKQYGVKFKVPLIELNHRVRTGVLYGYIASTRCVYQPSDFSTDDHKPAHDAKEARR